MIAIFKLPIYKIVMKDKTCLKSDKPKIFMIKIYFSVEINPTLIKMKKEITIKKFKKIFFPARTCFRNITKIVSYFELR
jgi:hypothetical protein